MRKVMRVVLPDRLEKWIERFVDRSGTLLKSNPWSYCSCPATAEGAHRAHCRTEAGGVPAGARGPDLAAAKPETCSGCVYNLTDARFRG
jgi:hypothetical protein